MQRSITCLVLVALVVSFLCAPALGRDAAQDLKKMKGFIILDATVVNKVANGDGAGKKTVTLQNGMVFTIDFLLLDPLPLTDVIVFAMPLPADVRAKFKDLPERMLYQYKLLINNEAYDATPQ